MTTADDFANAEFARHENGNIAVRGHAPFGGRPWSTAGWVEFTDAQMALDGGWSPVRECPNPEQHDDLLRLGRLVRQAQHDQAGSVQIGDVKIAPCDTFGRTKGENDERRRAEKAEQERDEARRDRDTAKDHLRQAMIELRALDDRPVEPRPLAPDDITDEMVERGVGVLLHCWPHAQSAGRVPGIGVRELLTAALTVPTRPEGAEEIEAILDGYEVDEQRVGDLADFLAFRGVRVEGSGR